MILTVLVFACAQAPTEPAQNPATLFDRERAWKHLIAQCDFGPRPPGTEAHKKCRDYIVAEAKKHTDKVILQEFTHKWSKTGETLTMWNVVAEMNFGKPKTVLLLAHWDTRPFADWDPDPAKRNQPILGANDGASGVAVLLELMRVFKENPPPVNVTFLFTDGEDLGPDLNEMFLGAKHFVTRVNPRDYWYGILLDMIGDKDLKIPKEPNSIYYARSLVDRFYRHAHEIGLGSTFPMTTQSPIEDDHIPLNLAGIPTMNLIDFDYEWWHTTHDTPDKCSPESLGKVGRAVESFLRAERP